MNLRGRSFVSVRDFSGEEIWHVLNTAVALKRPGPPSHARQGVGGPPAGGLNPPAGGSIPLRGGLNTTTLAGKTLAMIFQKPSLRTRVSFEAGMTQLGGHAIYLAPSDVKLGERETIEDVALVLSRYVDVIMARVFEHDIVEQLARYATVPVINGLSDREHPCQILADLQTVYEKKGRLEDLRLAYIGDGNNVAHSLLYGGARTGLSVTVASPPGYEPDAALVEDARRQARETGAELRVTNDPREAAREADVLYTDVWASMGQESEAEIRRQAFKGFQINQDLVSLATSDAIILHCLPAHYGEEIDYEASRLPGSAIFDQAENRLHAQKALLVLLVE